MTKRLLTCADCKKKDKTVQHTICPYAEDVENERIEVDLCPDCKHERAMDV